MTISKKARKALAVFFPFNKGDQIDHVKPKSKGGSDSIDNLQVISGELNMKKSDSFQSPRKWQEEFWDKWASASKREFLLTAIPGAGKTYGAMKIVHDFLLAGQDRRILIVVPTVNLQEQWRTEASDFGIALQTKEFGTQFRGDFTGAVATYQSLDTSSQIFKYICARSPTLVILDEPHHCADKESWGLNTKEAFNLAKRILLLSGTPFRTDGKPIPFVQYDGEGFSISDYRYDYPRALTEGIVRLLRFDYNKGNYDWFEDGTLTNYEFHSGLSEKAASERLSKILNPSGKWVKEQIVKSHEQLRYIRKHIPDAAAMAICMGWQHAEQIAKIIHDVSGAAPSVIVSDDDIATDSVNKFRIAQTEWVVSVRQVSEGTDIKRLQVLCWLTNTATELFFRQVIGRVSRVRFPFESTSEDIFNEDNTGYVFLPDDPRLIAYAERLKQVQVQALIQEAEREKKERIGDDDDEDGDLLEGVFVDSSHDGTARVIMGLEECSIEDARRIKCIADDLGVSLGNAKKFFQAIQEGRFQASSEQAEITPIKKEKSYEEKLDGLRTFCNKKAYRLSQVLNCRPNDIHLRFRKPQRKMNLQELEEKRKILLQCIIEQRMP